MIKISLTMKTNGIVLLVVAITFLPCCENNHKNICACGLKDPITELNWLDSLTNSVKDDVNIESAEIILYTRDDLDYFLITLKNSDAQDLPQGRLFNCEGILRYSCGGNQPIDSCAMFLSTAKKISTIWKK